MTALLPLLAVSAMLLAADDKPKSRPPRLDLNLQVDSQVRGGWTQSPFLTGPDGAPLANLAVAGGDGPQPTFNAIVTPGVTLGVHRSRFLFELGYQPRLFFDLLTGEEPSVFHGLNLNLQFGREETWRLSFGANLSIGGLNLGQAGTALNQFAGSPVNSDTSALSFFSTAAFVRVEHRLSQSFKLTTTETASKLGTPPQAGSGLVTGALSTATNTLALQSQDRLDSDWLLEYAVSSRQALQLQFLATLVSFPATATFLSYWPSLGTAGQFGRGDKWGVRLGAYKFWTNPSPGVFLNPEHLITGLLSIEHNFAGSNLPRLNLAVELGEQPYYDIIYGVVSPRASLNATLTYDFTRALKVRLQLRDYTQAYFNGARFVPIPKQRDKNVIVASSEVSYQYVRWLGFVGGLYALHRWIQPSQTLPYDELSDYYGYVGLRGAYDIN